MNNTGAIRQDKFLNAFGIRLKQSKPLPNLHKYDTSYQKSQRNLQKTVCSLSLSTNISNNHDDIAKVLLLQFILIHQTTVSINMDKHSLLLRFYCCRIFNQKNRLQLMMTQMKQNLACKLETKIQLLIEVT